MVGRELEAPEPMWVLEGLIRTSALRNTNPAHVKDPILLISKRLHSSSTFPRIVPVHLLPAHPTRLSKFHPPSLQVRAPRAYSTGANHACLAVAASGSYCSVHVAVGGSQPHPRPNRPARPVAPHVSRRMLVQFNSNSRLEHTNVVKSKRGWRWRLTIGVIANADFLLC